MYYSYIRKIEIGYLIVYNNQIIVLNQNYHKLIEKKYNVSFKNLDLYVYNDRVDFYSKTKDKNNQIISIKIDSLLLETEVEK